MSMKLINTRDDYLPLLKRGATHTLTIVSRIHAVALVEQSNEHETLVERTGKLGFCRYHNSNNNNSATGNTMDSVSARFMEENHFCEFDNLHWNVLFTYTVSNCPRNFG